MVSVPAAWIDEVIRSGPAGLLKRHGYKKNRRRFVKENAESLSIIEFQASQWNTDSEARFTINICSHFPSLEVLTEDISPGKTFTRLMASVGARIGHLMPEKEDYWWAITPDSSHTKIGLSVCDALEKYALPYLHRVATIEGLAEHGQRLPMATDFPSLVAASALAVLGRQSDAMALFDEHVAKLGRMGDYEHAWLRKYARNN